MNRKELASFRVQEEFGLKRHTDVEGKCQKEEEEEKETVESLHFALNRPNLIEI